MKKLTTIFCLVLAACSASIGQTTPDNPQESAAIPTTWQSLQKDNYEIKYPPEWEADKNGQMGSSFVLFTATTGIDDRFRENINLLIQDLSGYNINLDLYVEISVGQIQTMVEEGNLILSERMQRGALPYQKVIYTGKHEILNLKFEQYYWVIDDKAYVLTFTCEQDQFDTYQAVGEKIMNSFVFK